MISSIEKLHIQNIGLFDSINAEFNPKMNIIIGPNGAGKTSILRGITYCNNITNLSASRIRMGAEFWIDAIINNNERLRIGTVIKLNENQAYRQQLKVQGWLPTPKDNVDKIYFPYQPEIPLKIYAIGANRHFDYHIIQGMSKENSLDVAKNFYKQNNPNFIDGSGKQSDIKQWMINRYFSIDKEWAKNERENWHKLIEFMPGISPDAEFKFVNIGQDLEIIFSLNGKECYLEELSSGYKSVLTIILSIINWCELVNSDEERIMDKATGTVLIDEIDSHLHPVWQMKIIEILKNLFPKLQFIVTTHSPHIVASAEINEVIRIPMHSGTLNIKPEAKSYSGWQLDYILEDLMGIVPIDDSALKSIITSLQDALDKNDINQYDELIQQLELLMHPNDPLLKFYKLKKSSLLLNDKG